MDLKGAQGSGDNLQFYIGACVGVGCYDSKMREPASCGGVLIIWGSLSAFDYVHRYHSLLHSVFLFGEKRVGTLGGIWHFGMLGYSMRSLRGLIGDFYAFCTFFWVCGLHLGYIFF